jgi:hypothetical protein
MIQLQLLLNKSQLHKLQSMKNILNVNNEQEIYIAY